MYMYGIFIADSENLGNVQPNSTQQFTVHYIPRVPQKICSTWQTVQPPIRNKIPGCKITTNTD